jgi:hypothetical protein
MQQDPSRTGEASSPGPSDEENDLASGRMRETTEPPPRGRPTPASELSDDERAAELNEDTGTNASADDIKDRIDSSGADIERGASDGEPDPVTHENVEATEADAQGRPRGGAPGH